MNKELQSWIESVARQATTKPIYHDRWSEKLKEHPDDYWHLPGAYFGGDAGGLRFPCKDLVALGDREKIIAHIETEIAIARVKG